MFSFYDLLTGENCAIPDNVSLSCALGSFDGVHIGHRSLIENAAAGTQPVCVFTFSQNPFGAFLLTPPAEKLKLFALCGARYAAVFDFEKLRGVTAEDFVSEVLIGTFGCKNAVCGFNYSFGKDALGTPELLSRMLAAVGGKALIAEPVTYKGEPVSSSRIRRCLEDGDTEDAAEMLGRPFSLSLPVVHGNAIGRTLGFPTVNFDVPASYAMPAPGVYVTRCEDKPSVTNIGRRPTVTDGSRTVCETHIIGEERDLYGKTVTVQFFRRLRDEVRFNNETELMLQLEKDRKASLSYFG